MARAVLIEIIQVEVLVPKDLPAKASAAVLRTLRRSVFRTRLENAIRSAFQTYPTLKTVRVRVSW